MGIKVIYSFILLGILLSIESCYFFRRPLDDTPVRHSWFIVNRLEQEVIVKIYTPSYSNVGGPFYLYAGNIKQDSTWLMEYAIIAMGLEPFEYLKVGTDSVGIYALDGKTLKVWRMSEENENERPFFHKPFWQKQELLRERRNPISYRWTFELLPEDIEIQP